MTPKSLQSRLKIAKNAKFGSTETGKQRHAIKLLSIAAEATTIDDVTKTEAIQLLPQLSGSDSGGETLDTDTRIIATELLSILSG
ncbi:hypothetical protein KFU94_33890 [Chloroflexi bacterium TSY]|nr:hypothetical protein [Chloroflexi bacterium TSY]